MGQIGFSHDRIFLLNKNKSYWKPGLPTALRLSLWESWREAPERARALTENHEHCGIVLP